MSYCPIKNFFVFVLWCQKGLGYLVLDTNTRTGCEVWMKSNTTVFILSIGTRWRMSSQHHGLVTLHSGAIITDNPGMESLVTPTASLHGASTFLPIQVKKSDALTVHSVAH